MIDSQDKAADVFRALEASELTKDQIAQNLGLRMSTVKSYLRRLMTHGLVASSGTVSTGKRGRRPVKYRAIPQPDMTAPRQMSLWDVTVDQAANDDVETADTLAV